ncbi:MAG: Rrf2 family transcriptional regulator [Cytophagales bacterium]|nr:Rrf2 family transcriptional regulator [Armatimonadota bacterium]
MNFTAKEDYGLRAVLDLAVHDGSGPVQTREIASRQRIPEQFLEQLLAALRRAEVVRSTRGAGGGYALASSARQITVGHVLRALSGPLVPAELIVGDAAVQGIAEAAVVRGIWESLECAIRGVADGTSLQDLLDRRSEAAGDAGFMMHI